MDIMGSPFYPEVYDASLVTVGPIRDGIVGELSMFEGKMMMVLGAYVGCVIENDVDIGADRNAVAANSGSSFYDSTYLCPQLTAGKPDQAMSLWKSVAPEPNYNPEWLPVEAQEQR